jgi:hypothetical protein
LKRFTTLPIPTPNLFEETKQNFQRDRPITEIKFSMSSGASNSKSVLNVATPTQTASDILQNASSFISGVWESSKYRN